MSIQEICDYLKSRYPDWVSCKDITKSLGIRTSNVSTSLKKMRKREEIEFKMIWGKKQCSHFKYEYRYNGE